MAGEAPEYCAWLRALPCCSCSGGGSEPHHMTGAGTGLRAHDYKAIPLCRGCHSSFHDMTGVWKAADKEMRRRWQIEHVFDHLTRYTIALREVHPPTPSFPKDVM